MQSNNYVAMPMYTSAAGTEYTFECQLTEDVSDWGGKITIQKGSLPSRLFKTVNVVISKQDIASAHEASVLLEGSIYNAICSILEANDGVEKWPAELRQHSDPEWHYYF
ncbi:TPA: hypothetical protein ACNUX9_002284 [Providencia rettgeri]